MNKVGSKVRALGAAALAAPLALSMTLGMTASPAMAATAPASGAYADAYGLMADLTVLGALGVPVPEQARATSSCPPSAGAKDNSVLTVPADPVVTAKAAHQTAASDCGTTSSKAVSRIVDVDALAAAAQATIHADAVTATSTTSCTAAPSGSTDIVNLSVGGTAIPIPKNPVPPNTKVVDPVLSLMGLTIILNEQHPAAQGRGLVVNAIHVIASGTGTIPVGGTILRGDIVVAHAVSGVVCPGGPGSENGGLPKPDITFVKSAAPSVAHAGDTVTYTATVTNQSTTACEVLKVIDHVAAPFELVSSAGPLGTALDKPAPTRADGGVDAVLHPTGVTLGAGKSLTQTFTVTVKSDAAPGTYYDTLEIFCGPNGDFVSGPLAPVTIAAPGVTPSRPVEPPAVIRPANQVFAATGLNAGVPMLALVLLVAGLGARRLLQSRR